MKKKTARQFCGMTYREVQRSNSTRRKDLPRLLQLTLKRDRFRNVGWDSVIALCQKLNAIDDELKGDYESLEELFLKADRIGNKYQTNAEITQHWQEMAVEVSTIADLIDQQFPDQETEYLDFSQTKSRKLIASIRT